MSRDLIEFRLVAAQKRSETTHVEIHVNGRPLIDLWARASGEGGRWMRATDAFWPGHRLWTDDPPPNADLGSGDRRAVLVCVDGLAGCGGATARIAVEERLVTWSEFKTVPDGAAVTLGPLVFDRKRYEQALEKAAQGVR